MNPSIILGTLNSMSRDNLRAVATKLNVRRGRNKVNTVGNLMTAISNGDARFTVEFTVREKGTAGSSYANAVFRAKLRTHKPNKVLFTPNRLTPSAR